MQHEQRPYYLEHLIDCLNRMMFYRGVSTYAAQNRSNAGDKAYDKASNKIISGNLGCLVFQTDEHCFGADWIAASFKAIDYVKEVQNAEESCLLIEPANENTLVATYHPPSSSKEGDKPWNIEFTQSFPADHSDRRHDSEYLLLNYFDYLSANGQIPKEGRLSLISERLPCQSCTSVIKQFIQKYPRITVDVFYMHDTQDRFPNDFLSQMGSHDIRTIKIAFETIVHLVNVTGNMRVTVSPQAREQKKMFGGPPNQINQTIDPSR
jgi:hypothetical protein